MSTIYTGSPVLNTTITIPSPGDLASANSVNVSSKALMDMQIFLLQTYGQSMQSTSPIRIWQVTNTSITVAPIPLVVVQEAGIWKTLTTTTSSVVTIPTDVEGGIFQKNRFYYLYAYSDGGVMKFQISFTAPDTLLLYKQGGFTHKFLTTIRSNLTTDNICPVFSKYGNIVSVAQSNVIGPLPLPGTITSVGIESQIPPIFAISPIQIKVLVTVRSLSTIDNQVIISAGIAGINYPLDIPAGNGYTLCLDLMTDTASKIYFRGVSADSNITVTFQLAGYVE